MLTPEQRAECEAFVALQAAVRRGETPHRMIMFETIRTLPVAPLLAELDRLQRIVEAVTPPGFVGETSAT